MIFRSTGNPGESGDGTNTTEVVRYIRRRKFGRKRRSVYVKYRVSNNKTESNATTTTTTNTNTNTTTHEDEHSQEYIARRRDSEVDGSNKEDEEEEDSDDDDESDEDEREESPPASPPKTPTNQPKYKQLTLDQFLKKSSPTEQKIFEISPQNPPVEEPIPEVKNEDFRLPRRTKRLPNTHVSKSETDLTKITTNGESDEILKKPMGIFF